MSKPTDSTRSKHDADNRSSRPDSGERGRASSRSRGDAPRATGEVLLQARKLCKTFRMGTETLTILNDIDLSVRAGEWVSIVGASGSGKSTLLHLLAALDRPDSGGLTVGGREVFAMSSSAVNRYRVEQVGIVFQAYHLLPELTAMENVMISGMMGGGPARLNGSEPGQAASGSWFSGRRRVLQSRATALLEQLGLGQRLRHRPNKLSGGERQRVAIARALFNRPALLLADEPTGNLDHRTGMQILDLFQSIHAAGQTIIMVTHDPEIAARADRRLTLDETGLHTTPNP